MATHGGSSPLLGTDQVKLRDGNTAPDKSQNPAQAGFFVFCMPWTAGAALHAVLPWPGPASVSGREIGPTPTEDITMVRQSTTPKKDLDDGTNKLSEQDRKKLEERSELPDDERQDTERRERERKQDS